MNSNNSNNQSEQNSQNSSNPNDRQVGGDHYQSPYQHWDFVIETELPYVLGCATKYITRWRKKNGVEDLKKCKHYVEKAIHAAILADDHAYNSMDFIMSEGREFVEQNNICVEDANIFYQILLGEYKIAIDLIDRLINQAGDATPEYVNQDR